MVSIEINGVQYDSEHGKTILEIAKLNNIDIPTLCYNKALNPYGACRLCVVEILGNGWSKLATSCDLPVKEGLRIKTDSKKVVKSRKMTIEILASRCSKENKITDLAADYGIKKLRFKKDNDDCIQCGLCVRMCKRIGSNAINFSGRGKNREVITPYKEPSKVCLTCGACAYICPTSRFTQFKMEKNSGKKPIPILSDFNVKLSQRPAVYFPFPQSVPKIPVIDKDKCIYYQNGECRTCENFCDPDAIVFNQKDETKKIDVGAIVVSPGIDLFDATNKPELRYCQYPNVITSLEFERILSPSGPTEGKIELDGKKPKKIAWIQCVGSRDPHIDRGYCSSVCCMYAVKEAIIAKEHSKEIKPTIFYMDMRAYGKDFDKYIDRAEKDHDIRFIRSRISDIEEDPKSKNLLIKYESEDGFLKEEEYELVVLSIGINPPKDVNNLANKFGINLNKYNFAKTNSFTPFQTEKPGIFVAGAFTGPKDIPETVAQGSGVVAEVASLLSEVKGENVVVKEYPPEIDVSNKPARIGVFICHCGSNIAGFLNINSIVEYTKKLPKVIYAEDSLYSCSQDTQTHIKEMIKKYDLTRVVIASCTPRTHESLFQDTIREAGLNKHLFEMANIRDQCSWVHMNEPELGTEKAKQLVSMAVGKASLLKPLSTITLEINHSGLVIGGGLTGMMASLKLAEGGYEVFLIEKEKELGGNLNEIFYTLEGDNVQNFLKETIKKVHDNKLIHIFPNTQIENIEGYMGNFTTTVNKSKEKKEIKHGIIIVTTGSKEFITNEYLYGKHKHIITQRDLEKQIFNNQLNIEDNENIVMIQCVSSRDDNHPYCSRVCCSEAVKNAIKIKEKNKKVNVYIIYRDIRTYGFKEDYYQRARELGVIFIRYTPENKPKIKQIKNKLFVTALDPILNEEIEIDSRYVVLSVGMVSRLENEQLSKLLKVPLNEDGFFLEAHMKLRPVDFATDGIFLAGTAHAPKFIDESISQAYAAASRASIILSKDLLEIPGTVARVDEYKCSGCGQCEEVCTYHAIEMVKERINGEEKLVAKVNEGLCKGCGICAGTCRSCAIQHQGFKDKQILAMIKTFEK